MAPFIEELAPRLAEATGAAVHVHPVVNEFFGESVTVAGLLAGRDLLQAVGRPGRADLILVPGRGPECRRPFHRLRIPSPTSESALAPATVHSGPGDHGSAEAVVSQKIPVVAVVGRPNVGKSTLFNRFLGRRLAIVDDTPGVTRDRNFARADWAGRNFFVVDTGGVIEDSDEPLDRAVGSRPWPPWRRPMSSSSWWTAESGVHPLDEKLAEHPAKEPQARAPGGRTSWTTSPRTRATWISGPWAWGSPIPLSAISGKGSGDLLDAVVSRFPEARGGVRRRREPSGWR